MPLRPQGPKNTKDREQGVLLALRCWAGGRAVEAQRAPSGDGGHVNQRRARPDVKRSGGAVVDGATERC